MSPAPGPIAEDTPSHSPLIDTHAHLGDPRLIDDLDALIGRAREQGVVQILAVGTDAADSERVRDLARARSGIFATVGIHPNHAAEASPDDWDRVIEIAGGPRVVAIGETGLDRHWDFTPFEEQIRWFDRHIGLAADLGLPLVIHCRECEQDIIGQLRALNRPIRGVLHSFAGTWDNAQAFLDLGLHISFAGMVTFTNKNLDPLRRVASCAPIDRILVETDSPYLSPHPFRGKTNEPARVTLTAQAVAQARGISPAELAHLTTTNSRLLFALPDDDVL
jgi:TatD DNase family protein